MKSIKNSLKKLSYRLSFRESGSHNLDDGQQHKLMTEIDAKRSIYREGLPKLMCYKNYEFPEDTISVRVLESLDDLEIRANDIFLLSYPATSSHLLEDIVHSLLTKVKEKSSARSRKTAMARLEVSNPYGHIRWLKSLKSPRVFISNLPYDLMPAQLRTSPSCKVSLGESNWFC